MQPSTIPVLKDKTIVSPPTINVIGQAEAMRWLTVIVGSSKGMPRYPCSSCQIQLRYCLQTGAARPYLTMMLCSAAGVMSPWVKENGPPGHGVHHGENSYRRQEQDEQQRQDPLGDVGDHGARSPQCARPPKLTVGLQVRCPAQSHG